MVGTQESDLLECRTVLRFGRITKHLPYFHGLSLFQAFYRKLPDSLFPLRISDFDGDLLLDVDPRECIGVNLWHQPNVYEREGRARFCAAIKPGSVVLDVGANIGIFSLLAAKRGATVYAIEADPENAKSLRKHIELNRFSERIAVFEMAATSGLCQVKIFRDPANIGHSNIFSGGNPVTVKGDSIDSLALPPIDICKMDIEGAELSALEGMRETISRSPDMQVLIEELPQSVGLRGFLGSRFRSISELPTHPPTLWVSR